MVTDGGQARDKAVKIACNTLEEHSPKKFRCSEIEPGAILSSSAHISEIAGPIVTYSHV